MLEWLQQSDFGDCRLAPLLNSYPALAAGIDPFMKWCIDSIAVLRPASPDQRNVALTHLALAQLAMKLSQARSALGQKHQPRCLPIQSVDQFKKKLSARFRLTNLTQGLNHAELYPATAMDGKASRLINGNEQLIFKNHTDSGSHRSRKTRLKRTLRLPAITASHRGGHPKRRDAQHIALLNPITTANTAAVDSDLAGSQHAINPGLGDTLKAGQQKVIDPLSRLLWTNRPLLNALTSAAARRRPRRQIPSQAGWPQF
jgi:hypothetical protein